MKVAAAAADRKNSRRTLRDAAQYITKLPKAEHDADEWQAAMEALLLVAELDGPPLFARIIGARRLIPRRYVRRDVAIHQPSEQPDRAIGRVASEPSGPQIEAALNAVHHGLGDGNLHGSVHPSAHRIDDDPDLVVDEVVSIIGKEWVQARPHNPCGLILRGMRQRAFVVFGLTPDRTSRRSRRRADISEIGRRRASAA